MSIVVSLFAWIYARDRQKKIGLWMLGWVAIFIHFAAPVVDAWIPRFGPFTDWIQVFTLIVAGSCFLLSVSEVFADQRRRIAFGLLVSLASVSYLTALSLGFHGRWFYAGLLLLSNGYGMVQAVRYYGLRDPHLYAVGLILPYGAWVFQRTLQGTLDHGLDFYLFSFFYLTGLVYRRHFRRFSPGVIFTSASFVLWGAVFPVATLMEALHKGPGPESFFWDLPKFFVAFGMILTLFENQTEVATVAARQFQVLFENNLAAVYVATLEGRLLDCNSAFLRMYGLASKAEALAQPTRYLHSSPSGPNGFLEQLHLHGQVLNYECTHQRKDGSTFWVLERATIVTDAEDKSFIEGTAIDITERKQSEIALKESEERFATIFRQSPIACGILSMEGVFLNVNDTFLRLLALPAEKVIGKTSVELGFWKAHERADYFRKLNAEGSIQNLELNFKDAAGNQHVGLYFATLVRIGEKDCILGMLLDQTEERELEAKFLQAQKMESLGRMAGGVAHDFNNMLGVIGGYAELLEVKLEAKDNLRRYCTKIIDTTQRASGLTRQLLTFSRKEIVRPMPLQTREALLELSTILPRLIGEDIELAVNLGANGTVVIDKTHLEQIVFNIVINARDAMPGGGRLYIETEDVLRPVLTSSGSVTIGQYVAIRIRDTGVGMSEETRLHAFEPFYTTKEVGRGTGLGLATVYGIVQQCTGEISIESARRKGTQVTILLPVVGKEETAALELSTQTIKRGQGNILLVEDEAELRNVNAEFLTSMGYVVLCAGSGPEALNLVATAGPLDLVITDVVMPKMSGRAFAERMLQLRPGIKLLYISGYADDVLSHNGISMQGALYLQKPYTFNELASKIQTLLTVPART